MTDSVTLMFRWRPGLVLEATRTVTRRTRQLEQQEQTTDTSRHRLVVSAGPRPGQVVVSTTVIDKPQVALFSIPLPDLVVDAAGAIVDVVDVDRVCAFVQGTVPAGSAEHAALVELVTPEFVKNAAVRDWQPLVSLWAGRTLTRGKPVEVRSRDASDPRLGPIEMVTTLTLTATSPLSLTARSVPDAIATKRMIAAAMQQVAAALPGVQLTVKEQTAATRAELVTDAGLIPARLRVTRSSSTALEVKLGADVDLVTTAEEIVEETTFVVA